MTLVMPAWMALFLLGTLPAIAAAQGAGDFAHMVQTEYDFSAAATRTSQRAAFLEYIAADGILFRPGPVSAHKVLSEGKGSPGPAPAMTPGRRQPTCTSGSAWTVPGACCSIC